jgi:hypothetical protein
MAAASITLALLLIPMSTFALIFPIYQIIFAQSNETQSTEDIQNTATFNTILAAISGGLVGAAATLIGTLINSRQNMNLKKQELEHNLNIKKQEYKHALTIELLKSRIECYAHVIKYIEKVANLSSRNPNMLRIIDDLIENLRNWKYQEKGGLLVSTDSLQLYSAFLGKLLEARNKINSNSEIDVTEIEVASVKFKASLQRDIGVLGEIAKS